MRTNKTPFFYSNGNIAGSVLALAGLALFFTGIIHAFWWAIVPGLYGIGVLAFPRRSTAVAERAERIELSYELLGQQVQSLVTSVVPGLPPDCAACVRRIEGILFELLPRLQELRERGVIHGKDAFTVTETIRRYLPDTLTAYLRLPRWYAQFQPLADGQTASQALLKQLQLLEGSLHEIARNAFESDAENLILNGRFLQNRFAEKTVFRR